MSTETVKLTNDKGEFVEMSKELVEKLFAHEQKVNDMLNMLASVDQDGANDVDDVDEDDEDDEVPDVAAATADPDNEDVTKKSLPCSKKALEAIKEYAEWPAERRHAQALPKPLKDSLVKYLTSDEMDFVKRVEEDGILVELLDTALEVQFAALADMCAAYASVRVDEIAKAAPSIMEGAERIRNYLGLKNEWTEEEMKHLENEMKVLKEIDPNAY